MEDIKRDYEKILGDEKSIHPDLDEEAQKSRAFQRLGIQFKKQLRSPAVGFEGMILAASDKFDMVRKLRETATKAYNENPHQAIQEGITDDEGVPLDNRESWSTGNKNPGYGKPLPEHSWKRTVYGVALKQTGNETPLFFTLNMSGTVAENDSFPFFKPVKFRAIDRTPEENIGTGFTLNASMFTKFEKSDRVMPAPETLINQFCSTHTYKISELESYHEQNKTNYDRFVVVKGDVSTLVMEPTSTGSRRLIVESENAFEDPDALGATCWIAPHIPLDFAEESKVYIFGSTTQGKKYVDGAATDEPGEVMINAFGVYAIPEFKINTEVEKITEEDVTPDSTNSEEEPGETDKGGTSEEPASSW